MGRVVADVSDAAVTNRNRREALAPRDLNNGLELEHEYDVLILSLEQCALTILKPDAVRPIIQTATQQLLVLFL
jgi:hypothetical protein